MHILKIRLYEIVWQIRSVPSCHSYVYEAALFQVSHYPAVAVTQPRCTYLTNTLLLSTAPSQPSTLFEV